MYFDANNVFLVTIDDQKATKKNHSRATLLSTGKVVASFVAVFVGLVYQTARADDAYLLKGSTKTGLRLIQTTIEVGGELKLNPTGKKVTKSPLKVQCELNYDERTTFAKGLPTGIVAIRAFNNAKATIHIGELKYETALTDDRQTIALSRTKDTDTVFSPDGPLTREELELTDSPASRLILNELLPSKKVKVDESWAMDDVVLNRLLSLDNVGQSDVKNNLKKVEEGEATVEILGKVTGAVGGIATEIEIKGNYKYDLKLAQVTWFGLAIRENRAIGHAEPGFETITKVSVIATPIEASQRLADEIIAKLPLDAATAPTQIKFTAAMSSFELLMDRRWRVLTDRRELTVMRMVDRGELVAQGNISILEDAPAGKHTSLEELQNEVKQSLGTNFQEFLEAGQSVSEEGLRMIRVVAFGQAGELPIHWIYYVISNDQGRRVAMVFTLEAKLAEAFLAADRDMTNSFQFRERAPANKETEEIKSPAINAPKSEIPTATKTIDEKTR